MKFAFFLILLLSFILLAPFKIINNYVTKVGEDANEIIFKIKEINKLLLRKEITSTSNIINLDIAFDKLIVNNRFIKKADLSGLNEVINVIKKKNIATLNDINCNDFNEEEINNCEILMKKKDKIYFFNIIKGNIYFKTDKFTAKVLKTKEDLKLSILETSDDWVKFKVNRKEVSSFQKEKINNLKESKIIEVLNSQLVISDPIQFRREIKKLSILNKELAFDKLVKYFNSKVLNNDEIELFFNDYYNLSHFVGINRLKKMKIDIKNYNLSSDIKEKIKKLKERGVSYE